MPFHPAAAAWLKQPTTVGGLATLCGIGSAVLGNQLTWQQSIPAVIGALVAIALPDHGGGGVATAPGDPLVKVENNVTPAAAPAASPAPTADRVAQFVAAVQAAHAQLGEVPPVAAPTTPGPPAPAVAPRYTPEQIDRIAGALELVAASVAARAGQASAPDVTIVTPPGRPNIEISRAPSATGASP